jgi:tight adherence protein B
MDFLLVFACCAAGVLFLLAIYSFTNDLSARQEKSGESPQVNRGAASAKPPTFADIVSTASTPRQLESLIWRERCRLWIDQSGVDVSPPALIGLTCFAGVIPAGAILFVTHSWPLATLAYLLPAFLPCAFVAWKRRRRCNRLREQLPDALDLMSRMLRAGQTIPQSLRGVADEFEAPIADEFGYCYEQQNLGLSTDASMYEMARRTGVLELRILVVALTVHRRSGGNLSELLDNLAAVVRDRYRIYGQIRALTADGRMQAAILLALPPFLLAVLSVVNRDYITILYQFPWLLVGMFAFEFVGAIWLRRIVSFDF